MWKSVSGRGPIWHPAKVPNGAVIHEEEDDHDDEELSYIENSDFAVEATKFGISRAGEAKKL